MSKNQHMLNKVFLHITQDNFGTFHLIISGLFMFTVQIILINKPTKNCQIFFLLFRLWNVLNIRFISYLDMEFLLET